MYLVSLKVKAAGYSLLSDASIESRSALNKKGITIQDLLEFKKQSIRNFLKSEKLYSAPYITGEISVLELCAKRKFPFLEVKKTKIEIPQIISVTS